MSAAAKTKKNDEAAAEPTPMTRREFLYYIWGASMAIFMAQGAGLTLWFAYPRFRAGEFGGVFTLPVSDIPSADAPPKDIVDGRFFLVNAGSEITSDDRLPDEYPQKSGVRALYKVCVHLGCLYKWVPQNNRFECPCHGSKYLASGVRTEGPATRNLDVFTIEAIDADGNVLAATEEVTYEWGGTEMLPLEIPEGAVAIRVDTGARKDGARNVRPGGGI